MPIMLSLKVEPGTPILRGFDFLWRQIREAGRADRLFTISEIDLAGNDRHRRSAADYIKRLVAGGYVETVGWRETGAPGGAKARTYRLLRRPVEAPHLRRDGSPTGDRLQAMWNAMRALRSFSAAELAVAATTDVATVTLNYARHYAGILAKAGYLVSTGTSTWRLKPSANSGPKAPRLLQASLLYDPNKGVVTNPVTAEERAL